MHRKAAFAALVSLLLAAPLFAQTNSPKMFLSGDNKTQVTVPPSWDTLELNDAADIEVGNEEEGVFLIVLNESKDDLFGWNLQKHSYVTLGNLLQSLSVPKITGPKSMKVGGSDALQYEIRGAANGLNIVYYHTTIDAPKHLVQILAWTTASQFDANREKLLAAVNSFKER